MSGTSVDGIDCAAIRLEQGRVSLLKTLDYPIPETIRAAITQLSHSGEEEIERMGVLDRQLGTLFAKAALHLLDEAGLEAADIDAIGSHGQTVRHRPRSQGRPVEESFTLQIGDPNTIAEITGITTVADFRRRDVAAGGEGAPLAPAFHADAFSQPDTTRAIVNIGGIANVSLLDGQRLVSGFDTGPGNTLMDHWIRRHQGQSFDAEGAWAASGHCQPALLSALLQHPYLGLRGPRSTGKEAFNLAWLDEILATHPGQDVADVQATLSEYTALTIARAIQSSEMGVSEVYLCGGGAHNTYLRQRLAMALPDSLIMDTAALGIDPDWVEAATFAWLAARTLEMLPGNAPDVTGAQGPRVLGAIYPGAGQPGAGLPGAGR